MKHFFLTILLALLATMAGRAESTGPGVHMKDIVEEPVYKVGSTAKDWVLHINFDEPLAYRDFLGYAEHYGVDAAKAAQATCTAADGTQVKIVDLWVSGSFSANGSDAKAAIKFPYTMLPGVYDVYLPYGLFKTQSGDVTAETRFQVTVTGDDSPLTLKSFTPAEGYVWDASEATQTRETDGADVTATMTFDKVIARVAKPDAAVLTANYGAVWHPEPYITILNKQSVAFSLGALPDGNYTLEVPAGVFIAANGKGNSPFTLHFSVNGSKSRQWALPFYNRPTTTPANNAVVETLDEVTFAFSRNGYAAPCALLSSAASVSMLIEVYPAGADPNDPDVLPTVKTEALQGAYLTLSDDGLLAVKMPYTIESPMRLLVSVPEGAVSNLPDGGASLTARERFEQGGCVNPAASVTIIVKGKSSVDPEGPDTPDPEQPGGGEDPDDDPWALPTYTDITVTPADGSTVKSLASISIALSHDDYDDALGLFPGMKTAATAEFVAGTSTTPVEVTAAVKTGNLNITFAKPISEAGKVVVNIPKGMTNNLAMLVATMTPQEIYEEGGCTNPAMTLTFYVVPEDLPVRDVTGIGHDTEYKKDADGNFVKDEKGQYIRVDKYDSLLDARLDPAKGDRVTVIYFWYDMPFASLNYTGGASVTNVTTNTPVSIASVGFKSGGDSNRNNVIELRLASDSYIYSEEHHQGVYEVTLPAGIATTAEGVKSGGYTFRFTFGDPDQAYHPENFDFEPYVGRYEAVSREGEPDYGETFELQHDGNGYVITGLRQSSLDIPVGVRGNGFVLRATAADGHSFASPSGGDVIVVFQYGSGSDDVPSFEDGARVPTRPTTPDDSKEDYYIFIDAYVMKAPGQDTIEGGVTSYKQQHDISTGIAHDVCPAVPNGDERIFGLDGRSIDGSSSSSAAPRLRIVGKAKRVY